MKTTVEILTEARALIAAPGRWINNGHYAVAENGEQVSSLSEDACSFCAMGALYHAGKDEGCIGVASMRLYDALYTLATPWNNVMAFNDSQTTVEPVLALYDEAIALAKAEHGA